MRENKCVRKNFVFKIVISVVAVLLVVFIVLAIWGIGKLREREYHEKVTEMGLVSGLL